MRIRIGHSNVMTARLKCFLGYHDIAASWTKKSGGQWEYEERCRRPGCGYCKIEGKAPPDPATWDDVAKEFDKVKKEFDSFL